MAFGFVSWISGGAADELVAVVAVTAHAPGVESVSWVCGAVPSSTLAVAAGTGGLVVSEMLKNVVPSTLAACISLVHWG